MDVHFFIRMSLTIEKGTSSNCIELVKILKSLYTEEKNKLKYSVQLFECDFSFVGSINFSQSYYSSNSWTIVY